MKIRASIGTAAVLGLEKILFKQKKVRVEKMVSREFCGQRMILMKLLSA
ncbi:MAG: hypothetical protein GPJ52_10650 [Candidatus Heimdallarchaeota archaeon]|nr:hypothetical protein [Candidatus Heimdallarchaeota archaeon]